LAQSGKTKEVFVSEIEPRVIRAILPRIGPWLEHHYPEFKWKVIQSNAEQFIKVAGKFDWILWDIWPVPDFSEEAHEKYVNLSTPALNENGVVTTWHNLAKYRKEQKYR
jgi:spermidine synthase